MNEGGLGWLPFDCCVFITYTRELKKGTLAKMPFVAGLARVSSTPRPPEFNTVVRAWVLDEPEAFVVSARARQLVRRVSRYGAR